MMILDCVWLRVVILGGESKISVWVFLPLLQHLLLSFFFFFFSFFFFQFWFDYLYEFLYGFDEFGSKIRTILMILWCVRDDLGLSFSGGFGLFLGWVSWWVLIDFELSFPVGLSWFWVRFSNCFFVDFGLILYWFWVNLLC